jgi:hypothetical protein
MYSYSFGRGLAHVANSPVEYVMRKAKLVDTPTISRKSLFAQQHLLFKPKSRKTIPVRDVVNTVNTIRPCLL